MKGLLLFLFGSQAAHAGTVLMPAFFPEEEGDRAHANRFHDSLLIELIAAGHTAIGQDALRSRVGRIVDTCAVTSDCPERLFSAWPAPVAVIGEVYSDGEDKGVVVSIYSPASESPIRVFDQTVLAGSDWDGVEGILEEVAGLMPAGDTEEGALSLLDNDFDGVRAVQAEGAAAEAAEANMVERLGYVESEDPMGDEEILALLGLGGDDEPPESEPEPQPVTQETSVPEVAEKPEELAESEEAAQPELEEMESPAVVDAEELNDDSSEELPVEEDTVEGLDEEESSEELPVEEDTFEEIEEEEPSVSQDPEQNGGDDEREGNLEEPSAESLLEEESSVYDVEVLPVLPEIQVADEELEVEPPPRSSRPERQEPRVETPVRSGRDERRRLNLDPLLYGALKRSEMGAEDWLAKWRPHVNNAHIEVFGGMPYGDVVRSYDVRLTLDANSLETIGSAQRDLFVEGVGYEFGASFGYTPIPWLDFSALFSVVGGVKELTTAWFTLDGVVVAEENLEEFSPAQSWQAIVEPRVRLYLLPISWVKLYGLGGITVRFSDGFEAPDLNTVAYPDRPSWTNVGWMVGGGLMIDPSDSVGIFFEAPWVHWFSPGDSYSTQSGMIPPKMPGPVSRTGWILRGSAGIQFRL